MILSRIVIVLEQSNVTQLRSDLVMIFAASD